MKKIPESELVVNGDGSIYHLNLKPEHIAETIITVGDPGRVAMVSKYFDKIEFKGQKREFVTHTGQLGNKRLTVISTGIGPDNIDIVMNELDALVNIDLDTRQPKSTQTSLDIIRMGTSGCLQPGVEVGSLVLSVFAVGLDNLMHFYHFFPDKIESALYKKLLDSHFPFPTRPYAVQGSEALLNALGEGLRQGITMTAPGFYAPQGRSVRLESRLQGKLESLMDFRFEQWPIMNFEMESSAIYGLSKLLGHRALSCNVILANRADKTFSNDPKGITEYMIKTMLERLERM
ncbi:MAG: nucleoside phosphorylase [Saprospiraceae bacterium]|nr:nucleoside phosphorylase [Saprospiraceae bacterium]MCB9323664.1 nucleoside phosphorylase [Lewinellaceae bacterium]